MDRLYAFVLFFGGVSFQFPKVEGVLESYPAGLESGMAGNLTQHWSVACCW